ncbi:MAG TPA: RtcB family protein, partial [Candidatus Ozemobacteraceae bacterium]|nr:RtcB family protein [Candidatus Ozemobacteraceae bacterium]
MEWVRSKAELSKDARVPLKSWCPDPEAEALTQAANLAAHPAVVSHIALMPDCHVGYGMPIGGVIACKDAVIPNAVGVDIGCGMGAVRTTATIDQVSDPSKILSILEAIKRRIPVGEGCGHGHAQNWKGFAEYEDSIGGEDIPLWIDDPGLHRDRLNLGTLGGGNHFIELQADTDGVIWLMLHSGSRNLGYRVANFYHRLARSLNDKWRTAIPSPDLAFLPLDAEEG